MKRLLTAAALAATVALTGCVTGEEYQRQILNQDATTCTSYGAEYGSPAHYQCMLIQQERRDRQAAINNAYIAWGAASIANTRW